MVVVMDAGATDGDIEAVVTVIDATGGEAFVSRGEQRTIIGLVGDIDQFVDLNLEGMAGVAETVRISTPFKLVSRDLKCFAIGQRDDLLCRDRSELAPKLIHPVAIDPGRARD